MSRVSATTKLMDHSEVHVLIWSNDVRSEWEAEGGSRRPPVPGLQKTALHLTDAGRLREDTGRQGESAKQKERRDPS